MTIAHCRTITSHVREAHIHLVLRLGRYDLQISIKIPYSGKTIVVYIGCPCCGVDAIKKLKERIQNKGGIPLENQHLIFEDKLISEDWKTLKDYNIDTDSPPGPSVVCLEKDDVEDFEEIC